MYQQARRLDPHNPARHVDVSAILCNLGRWEDAAIALLEALAIRPDDPAIVGRLVEVYRRLGTVLDVSNPIVRRHRCAAYREARRRGAAFCAATAP